MSLPLAASSSSEISLQKRMGQFQFQQLSVCSTNFMPLVSMSISNRNLGILRKIPVVNCSTNNTSKFIEHLKFPLLRPLFDLRARLICRMTGSDIMSQLELGKPEERRKPDKRVSGIFWIILINLGVYVADHIFQVRGIKSLYLYHNWPAWYQFVTASFCHASWNHLSSNLFFLYIFGKLVEEEEGNFALWLSYFFTGAGANLVSWLVLPRNAVSVGASGAVFGLFAISVLVKMSWDWRKILEVLILGQFVIEKVMEAAQASTAMSGSFRVGNSINHIAHLSGALVGVFLVWLLSKIPSEPLEQGVSDLPGKRNKNP